MSPHCNNADNQISATDSETHPQNSFTHIHSITFEVENRVAVVVITFAAVAVAVADAVAVAVAVAVSVR